MENQITEYDVVIVGAGPAGTVCALALKDSGLKVALIDKAKFPRDKICGDAIPGRALKVLNSISKELGEELRNFERKNIIKKSTGFYGQDSITTEWVQEAYTSTRLDFDNFLLELCEKHTSITIFTETAIISIEKENNSYLLATSQDQQFKTKILVAADGANSFLAKELVQKKIDRNHHIVSVRAYYKNVENTEIDNNEFHYDKKIPGGYFWIFPLQNQMANVGYGMLSNYVLKDNVNIKKAFQDYIDSNPILVERFKNSTQTSKLAGFNLPLASQPLKRAGDNFILIGDAASIIDPLTGEGIGGGMFSGKIAADTIVNCFSNNDFTYGTTRAYEVRIEKHLIKGLKKRYFALKIAIKVPFLHGLLFKVFQNKFVLFILKKLKIWF